MEPPGCDGHTASLICNMALLTQLELHGAKLCNDSIYIPYASHTVSSKLSATKSYLTLLFILIIAAVMVLNTLSQLQQQQ